MDTRKGFVLLVHALIGWALCAATMGIGMAALSLQNALIVHAVGAPIYFTLVSLSYFKRFNYTTPLQTALFFTGVVITVDFFVVALLINRSLEMFASLLGTWIPFALIFASTYLTGLLVVKQPKKSAVSFKRLALSFSPMANCRPSGQRRVTSIIGYPYMALRHLSTIANWDLWGSSVQSVSSDVLKAASRLLAVSFKLSANS